MGKHRSRLKILARILSIASNGTGAKKTQIMYQAYLSYDLLIRYTNDLIQSKLLVCDERNFYKLTTLGQEFLSRFDNYDKLCLAKINVGGFMSYFKSKRRYTKLKINDVCWDFRYEL